MKLTMGEIQDRREKIILTAFRLFCSRGIEAVSLLEIAKEAGVGETTIYRYFENKLTLVLAAFIRLWDLNMGHVDGIVEGNENYLAMTGYEQVESWITSFKQLYLENSDFVLFSYEAKLYFLRHDLKINQYQQDILMNPIKAPCLAAIEKGKADGSIPTRESSEDIFYAIWGSIRGYIVKIVIYDRLYDEDSPWEKRYDVLCRGILSSLSSGWAPTGIRGRPEESRAGI